MLKVGTARFQKIQNKSAIGKQMLRIMARVDCMIQISVCRGRKTSLDLRAENPFMRLNAYNTKQENTDKSFRT